MRTTKKTLRRSLALGSALTALTLPLLAQTACSSGPSPAPSAETVATASAGITSTKADKSLTIEVMLPAISAYKVTSNETSIWGDTRDETYLAVSGQTPQGIADARLPRKKGDDDYYEFIAGNTRTESTYWTNQDDMDMGYPRIWNGTLMPGETAHFQVALMEQDWKGGGDMKIAIQDACKGLQFGVDAYKAYKGLPSTSPSGDGGAADAGDSAGYQETLNAVLGDCKDLAGIIPVHDNDDRIGVFQIDVANVDGKLTMITAPINLDATETSRKSTMDADKSYQAAQEKQGRLVDTFFMNGAGASYRADIAVKVTDDIKNPLRYIGHLDDGCGQADMKVIGSNGATPAYQGTERDVRLATEEFHWTCNGSMERTVAPGGSDYVRVRRESASVGRQIDWAFFHEDMVWTDRLADGFYKERGNWVVWRFSGNNDCYVRSNEELDEFNTAVRDVDALDNHHTYQGGCAYPHCSDGVKDKEETDVDCGGARCGACAVGRGCGAGSDCASGLCNPNSHVCVATTCQDGVKDGNETDVDCGGSCGGKCGLGQGCGADNDCATNICNAVSKRCSANTCSNGVQDANEQGVDCGAACPHLCPGQCKSNEVNCGDYCVKKPHVCN